MTLRQYIFILVFCIIGPVHGQSLLKDINHLNDRSVVYQQSSYDRTGYNMDYFQYARFGSIEGNSNFNEVIKSGQVNNPGGITNGRNEYVLCRIQGPAVLERIWLISLFTGDYDVTLKFYFDGESTPRLTATDRTLFEGNTGPFVPPLVHQFAQSSGGSISYLKMNINESLIITVDSARIFYQFGYRQLSPDTALVSWTGEEDNSYLTAELNKAGTYPKNNQPGLQKDTLQHSLAPGQSTTIFQSGSAGSIEGIQLHIPQLVMDNAYLVNDSGRYHKGRSRFRMKVDPNASSYKLVRRMSKMSLYNTFTADIATVRVDNVVAGNWTNTDYRDFHFWEDATFTIPPLLCRGKSQVNFDIAHVAGTHWNEFFYWVVCDGVVTDSLDVGNVTSEAAHNYTITQPYVNPITHNFHNARYLTPAEDKSLNHRILDSLYIRIVFDDEIEAVNCPIGLFFGTGVNDAAEMKALPAGMQNDIYYNYFSMPFWANARVELENRSSLTLTAISSYLFSSNQTADQDKMGYFFTQYHTGSLTEQDSTIDYIVADISGKGMLVGHVVEGVRTGDSTIYNWLEGDERIYIDDNLSPLVHGTGTEDLYNATFYFVLDEFSLPQHGMTNSDRLSHRSMYRFHLADPIYFSKNMLFGIEHGDYNNRPADYQSLAFFYLQPDDTTYVQTDAIDVGDPGSEAAHNYGVTGNSVSINTTSAYEGPDFRNHFPLTGRSLDHGSSFTVQIRPDNDGVRLLRTLYFKEKNQTAKVYADDELVGTWLTPGDNPHVSWQDDFFYIPGHYTAGKSKLNIRMENLHPVSRWTEMAYKVYVYLSPATVNHISEESRSSITVFPNPTFGKVGLNNGKLPYLYTIYDIFGRPVAKGLLASGAQIDLSVFPNGTYILALTDENRVITSHKILLQRP